MISFDEDMIFFDIFFPCGFSQVSFFRRVALAAAVYGFAPKVKFEDNKNTLEKMIEKCIKNKLTKQNDLSKSPKEGKTSSLILNYRIWFKNGAPHDFKISSFRGAHKVRRKQKLVDIFV